MLLNNLKCVSMQQRIFVGVKTSFSSISTTHNVLTIMKRCNNKINSRNDSLFGRSTAMSRRYEVNGTPPRKIARHMSMNTFGGYSSMDRCSDSRFYMDVLPPPMPPCRMNCGEIREHHDGTIVEMNGKVNRTRLGRFIELKDQYGIFQLIAPIENINVSKRFANMPLNAYITIVGQVKRRPNSLKNLSMATGEVEVHVDSIIRVQKTYQKDTCLNASGKRHYSTSAAANDKGENRPHEVITAITSTECKHVNNDENLVQWFINRKHTCASLRLCDAGKLVSLVGWTDKRNPKFVHLVDGYGSTQILIESENLKSIVDKSESTDLVLVQGRVSARPPLHITRNNATGEIELFADKIEILSPEIPYHSQVSQVEPKSVEQIQNKSINVNEFTYRSHNCGELRQSDVGTEVTLCGWLEFSRMKRFFTLRDGYGHTQVLIPEKLVDAVDIKSMNYETILKVTGKVIPRPENMKNKKMKTGDIEIELTSCDVLNKSLPSLPVQVRSFNRSNEALRMKYRYVDLRFEDMQHNLRLRSNVLMKMREYLINSAGFVEVETPTLFRRTPGGAQEFVVPTQKPGQFYSLVQSPQQFKQMLMAGAIDRYFQIARCYRDETTSVNRQPEFTQLDIELSFTKPESIMQLIENTLMASWPSNLSKISTPFRRMTYKDAMETYGSDKPDTRSSDFLLKNVTNFVKPNEEMGKTRNFGAYAIVLSEQIAKSLKKQYGAILKRIEAQNENVKFVCLQNNESTEAIISKLNGLITPTFADELKMQSNDVAIIGYGNKLGVQESLGKVRLELISSIEAASKTEKTEAHEFLWIVDFPLFLRNDETGKLETAHHPFTAPHPDDIHLLASKETYEQCRSQAYDLVLNGQEIGGGSIRIHNADLQRKILNDILELNSEHLTHLIEALESGCPPHGGIALGIDRLISIMCKTNSIRDVIAFPKSAEGKDLLSNAPCKISKEELELYHLDIRK